MPRRIVLVDEHNYAGVGSKLFESLKTTFNEVVYLNLRRNIAAQTFSAAFGNGRDVLMLLIEPGTGAYMPKRHYRHWLFQHFRGVDRPDVPFGIYWCGSLCRVSNMKLQYNLPDHHIQWLVDRRNWLNSMTPLRMCATEDLEMVGVGSTFVGQPYEFPTRIPPKRLSGTKNGKHRIIHVPTAPSKTNCFKGTDNIKSAFMRLRNDKIVQTEIITYGTSNKEILQKMSKASMYVLTMTDWDSGTGYSGIEALSRGCLVFSRKPKMTTVKTPIIHVENSDELYEKVKFYVVNRSEYKKKRIEQFNWAKNNLSMEAIGNNIKNELQRMINNDWSR